MLFFVSGRRPIAGIEYLWMPLHSVFFKLLRRRRTLNIQSSIENIQSLKVCENIPIPFLA